MDHHFESAEAFVVDAVQWLKLGVEVIGAVVIGVGIVVATVLCLRAIVTRQESFTAIRLNLARYLALALEFQLGADILGTAVAPTWERIGQLGAVAVIRTGLNYFLHREMREGTRIEKEERKLHWEHEPEPEKS